MNDLVKAWSADKPYEKLENPKANRISFDLHFEPNSTNNYDYVGLSVIIAPRHEAFTYFNADFNNAIKTDMAWIKGIKIVKRHYDYFSQQPAALGSFIVQALAGFGDDLVKQGILKAPTESAGRFMTIKFKREIVFEDHPEQYYQPVLEQDWYTQEEWAAKNRLLDEQIGACKAKILKIKIKLEQLQKSHSELEAKNYEYRRMSYRHLGEVSSFKSERLCECELNINRLQNDLKAEEQRFLELMQVEIDKQQGLLEIGQHALDALKNGE